MKKRLFHKGIVLGIIFLFVGASFIPLICGEKVSQINDNIKKTQDSPNQDSPTKKALIFGRIENLIIYGNFVVFRPVKTRVITFNPFSFDIYYSGVMLITFGSKLGILTNRFVLGFFYVTIYIV